MTQKGFAPIAILIVLFLLAGGGYLTYQKYSSEKNTSAETKNDKQYSYFGELIRNSIKTIVPGPSPSPQPSPGGSTSFNVIPSPTSVPQSPTPQPSSKADYYVADKHLYTNSSLVTDQYFLDESVEIYSLRFYARFKNSQAARGSITYKAYFDGQLKDTKFIDGGFSYPSWSDETLSLPWQPGTHTVKLIYNEDRSLPELDYGNNSAEVTYTIKADTVPPTFDIDGPIYSYSTGQTCMRWVNLKDNVFVYTDVWANSRIDDQPWSNTQTLCISGQSGETHTFFVKAQDKRGNTTEKSKQFILY